MTLATQVTTGKGGRGTPGNLCLQPRVWTFDNQNAERVRKLALQRRNNVIVGSLIGLGVLSIYGYSIYSVKQEKFLDELE
ncbi:Cytochrome c oxidase assembly factor 3, mitochondrial [Portunus trituberculatus]|uniref:Cytochrome c oxidase assembly factor 3 n=1 Tax=Portunus trituberculatus TaxID=210409 RepID=A0A5B7EW70_PORTR|nr:Cytochrome c oxidase assembly factor 3, mitochondrial [Portunus trituberculatus]